MPHYGVILNMELVVFSVISVCKIQQHQQQQNKVAKKQYEYITACCNCMLMAIVLRSIDLELEWIKNLSISNNIRTIMCRRQCKRPPLFWNCLLFHNIPLWLATICSKWFGMCDFNEFTSSFPPHTHIHSLSVLTIFGQLIVIVNAIIWVIVISILCRSISALTFGAHKYHTIKRPKRYKKKIIEMHFISNAALFWLKPNWCVYLCVLTLLVLCEWVGKKKSNRNYN